MMGVVVRPAQPEDFLALASRLPPVRVRGYAGIEDGRVIAVGGVAHVGDGVFQAFFDTADPDAPKRYPVTLCRAAVRVLRDARAAGIPRVVAFAQEGVEGAERFLLRLGFVAAADGSGMFVLE